MSSWFWSDEIDDSSRYKIHPSDMEDVFLDPYKVLDVEKDSPPWEIRDRFRRICLQFNNQFVSLKPLSSSNNGSSTSNNAPAWKFKHYLLAFRLCNGDIEMDERSVNKGLLQRDLITGVEPQDIIPTLRPLPNSVVKIHSNFRASKFLACIINDYERSLTGEIIYHIQVKYLMRNEMVKRSFHEFEILHNNLLNEMECMPDLPDQGYLEKWGMVNLSQQMHDLREYLEIVNFSNSSQSLFSPTIMEFLGIDVPRLHAEEEGALIMALDGKNPIPGAHWQIVAEPWLAQFRAFIQGREARRYKPPGKIDQSSLLDKDSGLVKGPYGYLKINKHYRCVTYNVWRVWEVIHGGGPSICRVMLDIYSAQGLGSMQAIMRIQTCMRRAIHTKRFAKLKLKEFSKSEGAKMALLQVHMEDRRRHALEQLKNNREGRLQKSLITAIRFTQQTWRDKKGIVGSVEELQALKRSQEVFRQYKTDAGAPQINDSSVIEDLVPTISIPITEVYEVRYTLRLNVGFRKHPCSERSIISSVNEMADKSKTNDTSNTNNNNNNNNFNVEDDDDDFDDNVEFEKKSDIKVWNAAELGSILLAVNGVPTFPYTHEESQEMIKSADWPIVLRYMKQLTEADVLPLLDCCRIVDDNVRLQSMKRRLVAGIDVIFHDPKLKPYQGKIFINETEFLWTGRDYENDKYDLHSQSLYKLKEPIKGKKHPAFKTKFAVKVKENRCIAIQFIKTALAIELTAAENSGKDNVTLVEFRQGLYWTMDRILSEMKGSLLYIDDKGLPSRRSKPNTKFTTIGELNEFYGSHL